MQNAKKLLTYKKRTTAKKIALANFKARLVRSKKMEESIEINYDQIQYSQDLRVDRLTTMEQIKIDFKEILEAKELRQIEAEVKKLEAEKAEIQRLKEIETKYNESEESAPTS